MKVLYTFDDQNKTNCLARWPNILQIRTARLDQSTQIGVTDLKTCVQAIVTASPEIVAKLEQDYTVYAYDYSESDTPLVGQGMLSWVLGSASSSAGPALQPRALITGRVNRNIMGLFGSGPAETLEVKLRLVPMPTVSQNEYIESMKKFREISKIMPEGFDPQGWTDFLRANPGVLSTVPSRSHSPAVASVPANMGLEHVQRLFNDGRSQQESNSQRVHQRSYSQASSMMEGEKRRGSPTPSMQSTASQQTQQARRPLSRAASGVSFGDPRLSASQPIGMIGDDGYLSWEDRADEEPAPKRAKVVRADHPGRKSFGKGTESLRVAASSAASIRNVFQPTAVRPSQNAAHSLELPPRVPTPVPHPASQPRRPLLQTSKSNLSYVSAHAGDKDDRRPRSTLGETPSMAGSTTTSPEAGRGDSAGSTPADMASSPPAPVGRETSTMPPSSPVLPAIRRSPQSHEDSGFVSGALDSLVDCDLTHYDPSELPQTEPAEQHGPHQDPEPSQAQPNESMAAPEKPVEGQDPMARKLSRLNARRAAGGLNRRASSSIQPSSEALRLESEASRANRKYAPWDKEKRRAAINNKLTQSVENGEMPPFCDNCGAIETPTWRKAYWKIFGGSIDRVRCSNEEGGVVGVQILETNDDGSTKLFKVFKKQTLAEDQDFQEALLCNRESTPVSDLCLTLTHRTACGLWLANHKEPRPPHKWSKKLPVERKSKRGRPRKNQTGDAPSEVDSAVDRTDNVFPTSEAWNPVNGRNSSGERLDSVAEGPQNANIPLEPSWMPVNGRHASGEALEQEQTEEPDLPPLRETVAAAPPPDEQPPEQPTELDPNLDPDLFRDIRHTPRTSPDSFLGSRQSPIEVDKASPTPARRTLFPSPKTRGPLGVSLANSRGKGSATSSPLKDLSMHHHPKEPAEPADKENAPPSPQRPATPDRLTDLFYDISPTTPSRSSNPPPNPPSASRLDLSLFRTPAACTPPPRHPLTTGDFFSSAAKAFLHAHPGTPLRATPPKAAAAIATAAAVAGAPSGTGDSTAANAPVADATATDAPPTATPNTQRLHQLLADAASESPTRFLTAVRALPPPSTPGRDAARARAQHPTAGCSPGHLGLTPGRLFGSGGGGGALALGAAGTSSPPAGWFGVYEDGGGAEGEGEGWSELGLGSSPLGGLEGGEWRREGGAVVEDEAGGCNDGGTDVVEDGVGMAAGGVAVAAA